MLCTLKRWLGLGPRPLTRGQQDVLRVVCAAHPLELTALRIRTLLPWQCLEDGVSSVFDVLYALHSRGLVTYPPNDNVPLAYAGAAATWEGLRVQQEA